MRFPENSTVVVAHGAWADGSSWKEVILPLSKQGLQVVAAPLPLTSLSEDIVALNRTIARTKGPVIVAGHAYAGAVIAGANEERVKALVYVAALLLMRARLSPGCFTAMKRIHKLPSLLLTKMDGSGCRRKDFPMPSRITPRQIKLHCAKRCSGRSRSSAFRSRLRNRHGDQSRPGF